MKAVRFVVFAIVAATLLAGFASSPATASDQAEREAVTTTDKAVLRVNSRAVGSWFGRAVPIEPFCEPGTSGCPVPREVIMTPTFFADGVFMGSDSLTFGAPHTAAHGHWVRTGHNSLEANVIFLGGDADNHFIGAFRIRYLGEIVRQDRMEGFVNVWFFPFVDDSGAAVLDPETGYPIPDPLTDLGDVITDPANCRIDQGCLAVLEFVVRRIRAR